MTWITTVRFHFDDSADAARAKEAIDKVDVWQGSVTWDGNVATLVQDYGAKSKYAALRPALTALREIGDPLADSDYYEPFPAKIELVTEWIETAA